MNKCILAVAFSALFSGLHAIDDTPSSAARFTIPQIGAAFKSRQDGTMEYVIGIKLLDGSGIAANSSAAFAQFLKAADKGHPFPYFTVSQLYAGGVGTPRAENRAQSQASTNRKDKGKAKAPVEADVVAHDEEKQ